MVTFYFNEPFGLKNILLYTNKVSIFLLFIFNTYFFKHLYLNKEQYKKYAI